MYDLVIGNGKILLGGTVLDGSVCVTDGVIQKIEPASQPVAASEIIDAGGRHVLPGLVDAHVHFRDPGAAYKEGFENGSVAAALGGVTTILVMPTDNPMTSDPERVREKIALGARSHVDFGVHAIVGEDVAQVADLAALGCCAFELFLADVPQPLRIKDAEDLMRALQAIAAVSGLAGVTPMLPSIVEARTRELRAANRRAPLDFARSRPGHAEALGIALASEAAIAAGCRVHFRQVSAASSVDVIAMYKARRRDLVTAETLPHNLLLTEAELERQGPFAKMSPPLRQPADLQRLWQGLREGVLDIVVTDHAPHLVEEKAKGKDDIWASPLGVPGLETVLPLMLDQYRRGNLTLPRLVDALAERPARIFGLYPRKGTLAPGADADIVIVDIEREWEITNEALATRARYTPFHGTRGQGRCETVILRGRKIVDSGRVLGEPTGRFVRPPNGRG
jgi:dihydroorotase